MRGHYEYYRKIYLNICKNKEGLGTAEQLKKRIILTERLKEELIGMVNLMHACRKISKEEWAEWLDGLIRDFSPIELFGAYISDDGEVCSFREVSE